MTPGQLTDAHLAALQAADEARVLALFARGAIVHSPLYGPVPAAESYPALFRDTTPRLPHPVRRHRRHIADGRTAWWVCGSISPGAWATAGMPRSTPSTCSNWTLTA